jgi:hypothetical protein
MNNGKYVGVLGWKRNLAFSILPFPTQFLTANFEAKTRSPEENVPYDRE